MKREQFKQKLLKYFNEYVTMQAEGRMIEYGEDDPIDKCIKEIELLWKERKDKK